MEKINDCLLLFFISFLCFFIIYNLLRFSKERDAFSKKLQEKIGELSKQRDMLMEGGERVSTFLANEDMDLGVSNESNNFWDKIRAIMKKGSISKISAKTFLLMCCAGGAILGAIMVYFEFLHAITGIPTGFCVGAYLVFNLLSSQAQQKKLEFLKQFPDAIDMMIRGVKAGLNISRVVKLVSMEMKDPIAGEFKTISQKFDLGVKPETVLVEAADQIDIEEFRFLVVALVLQMENGGVLAEILQNLSGIVRKRLELDLKLKAMSAEARMSAIVVSALPFAFAAIMAVVNPGHIKEFITPGTGQTLLKITIVLFSLGTFFMLKATKIKV